MKQIDVLPDEVLLEIFDFYMITDPSSRSRYENKKATNSWQLLVHVCRRWRSLVLRSPRRLDLRLYCTSNTSIIDTLDIWPALPLIVTCDGWSNSGTDNIIAALGQSNRVCRVALHLERWQSKKFLAAMQVPFPELTDLHLSSFDEDETPVIPDSFLGGSAPRLQFIRFFGIPFPGLPKLLLSATQLEILHLDKIPHSGDFSPEAMVALLSVLSSLRILILSRNLPFSESRSLPPIKRSILPALTSLDFKGVSEYLEELVSRIDAPQLDKMHISLHNQTGTTRLAQFINRTSLRAGDKAIVEFKQSTASVTLRHLSESHYNNNLHISCRGPDRQLSCVAQVCSPLHSLSTAERLYIWSRNSQVVWNDDDIQNTLWLQLLLPFTAVKNLYVSKCFAPSLAAALQELVGDRITEVLPSLQDMFVQGLKPSGPLQEDIGQFVAARQLSNHPIAVSNWSR
jgi:F-box-like